MSMQNNNQGKGDPHLTREEKLGLAAFGAFVTFVGRVWEIFTGDDEPEDSESPAANKGNDSIS